MDGSTRTKKPKQPPELKQTRAWAELLASCGSSSQRPLARELLAALDVVEAAELYSKTRGLACEEPEKVAAAYAKWRNRKV